MKKLKFAGLLLLAPLTLLCACGGTTQLELTSNWYSNTNMNDIRGTETLTYDISFVKPSVPQTYGVVYESGTYTTSLSGSSAPVSIAGIGAETVYVYTTTLNASGYYFYGNDKQSFEDAVTTTVQFRKTEYGLTPLSSSANMKATALATANPTKLDGMCKQTHYLRETSYELNAQTNYAQKATVKITNLLAETPTPTTKEISLPEGNFFDNEQLLFALRATSLENAISFHSLDTQTNTVEQVVIDSPVEREYPMENVTINGTACPSDLKIGAYSVSLRYNKTMAGTGRTAVYAKKVTSNGNTYRNVLLRMETPLLYNLGTICYTLKSANFIA